MNCLLSTTEFVGQMGYQKPSNKKRKSVSHKKASWFEKRSAGK